MHILPVFVPHQPRHQLAQWLLHVHEDVSHHARTIILPSSDILFVFPAFAMFFLPNLLSPPMVVAASRSTLVGAGTGRVSHAPGFLRACRRGGHSGVCHD